MNKRIKNKAWEDTKKNFTMLIVVVLIYYALISGSNMAMIIVMGPLTVGLSHVFLSSVRDETSEIVDLFIGFKSFAETLVAYLLIMLFTFLWMLLFIIPGFIKAFAYSMTYYIMSDHPEMDAQSAILESRKMMDGNKMKLFYLQLSFIGWFILCILTLGLLLIWVYPYYLSALAGFYEEIRGSIEIPEHKKNEAFQI